MNRVRLCFVRWELFARVRACVRNPSNLYRRLADLGSFGKWVRDVGVFGIGQIVRCTGMFFLHK